MVALLMTCMLMPMSARADTAPKNSESVVPSVSIQLPTGLPQSPDGWDKPPVIAQLIAQGPGVVWYRFGAGPGPWQPCFGSLVIPPGKQLLSAVLIAPDGTPGQVTTIVARSDIHAEPFSQAATSQAIYAGAPTVAGVVTVSVLVGRQLGTIIRRLGGANRYGTGAVISSSVPTHGSTVIIATGEKFPDALTASGLAGCLDAPVLLVTKNHVPAETSAEIRRLRARRAIICGGPPAVSSAVATKLKSMGLSVERLSGPTRYETAVAVAARIRKLTGRSGRVFLARGDVFADALVVAPLAYKTRAAVLLSSTSKLRASTAQQLAAAHYSSATLIGAGLSAAVESGVRGRVPSVNRWSGSNQYDTAVQVASNAVLEGSLSWSYIGVARGDIFPDALCGGALCGKQGGVILLTPPNTLDPGVANALQAHMADVARCEIYGSDKAIKAGVFDQISAIFH
jgi:putative cell wall-binding protein